jgi:phosphoribosylglycinamide formyltransferase-1
VIRLGVLISGTGTNLQAILDAIAQGSLDAEVAIVVSNKKGVLGLDRATRAAVPAMVVPHENYPDRASFDAALVDVLRKRRVEWVVLAGFMRLLTPTFLDAFALRTINIHPALLPAFPGVDAPRQALEYGVRVAGCTVHLVDRGTDTGPIVAQSVVPVLPGDDEEALKARILIEEHRLLPRVLQWIAEGRVHVEAGGKRPKVTVAGGRADFNVT